MNWFKPKHSVCEICGAHYDPTNQIFGEYCYTHRQPKLDQYQRQQDVVAWAGRNWERLEKQYLNEEQERLEKMRASRDHSAAAVIRGHY